MLPGYLPLTPGNGIPFGGPQNFLQFYQDFSWTKGRHTFRYGGSYDYQRDNRTFGAYETPVASFAASGGIKSSSVNNFLNGNLGQFQGAQVAPAGLFLQTLQTDHLQVARHARLAGPRRHRLVVFDALE